MRLKFFKPAAIIIAGFMLITSCNKEEETIDLTTGQAMEQTLSLSDFDTYLNMELSEEIIHGDNVITVVDGESQTINQFTNDSKFKEWSYSNYNLKSSPNQNIYELNSFLTAVGKLAEEKGYVKTYEYGDKLPEEIQTLLETTPYFDQQGLKSAITWVQLYDYINRVETLGTVNTTFVPRLPNDMINKAESLFHYGSLLTAYCDGTWFKGEKKYIVGIPFLIIDDLEGFRNRIESIISIS